MSMRTVSVLSRSRSGHVCLGVGGGAATNTFHGRFIVRHSHQGGDPFLPPALFVKRRGNLACSQEQALVPIVIGDLLVTANGRKPVDPNNPDTYIQVERIDRITDEHVHLSAVMPHDFDVLFQFPTVVEGLSLYHNRDGAYFVGGVA